MGDYKAEVVPNQPWDENGTADVTPRPPCPISRTHKLPLEHRPKGQHTISRNNYPGGLVVLREDTLLQRPSAILPLRISSGDEILITLNQEWPNGGVAMFTES